jgi:hypothetical protein
MQQSYVRTHTSLPTAGLIFPKDVIAVTMLSQAPTSPNLIFVSTVPELMAAIALHTCYYKVVIDRSVVSGRR